MLRLNVYGGMCGLIHSTLAHQGRSMNSLKQCLLTISVTHPVHIILSQYHNHQLTPL